jgi:hypothetical protein
LDIFLKSSTEVECLPPELHFPNALIQEVGVAPINLMWDLFIHQTGPRIRYSKKHHWRRNGGMEGTRNGGKDEKGKHGMRGGRKLCKGEGKGWKVESGRRKEEGRRRKEKGGRKKEGGVPSAGCWVTKGGR